VISPTFAHAIEPEWQVPQMRTIAETSSQFLRYVRYDPRGVGLSDAYDGEFTVDSGVLDVEAVADAVSPDEPILLWDPDGSGPSPSRTQHGTRTGCRSSCSGRQVQPQLAS
jgi:pimeloyl-ACP methyl ester carboxylesterase